MKFALYLIPLEKNIWFFIVVVAFVTLIHPMAMTTFADRQWATALVKEYLPPNYEYGRKGSRLAR